MKKRFPDSVYNPVTMAGAVISAISFGLILFLIILDLFAKDQNPYMGIITFIILPSALVFGLLLIAYGIYREHKRIKSGKPTAVLPVIDLNNPKHRTAFLFFVCGTILLLVFTAFGSFKAYEYTESDQFCGMVCHKVMEPEYNAYQGSPHSKVGCVTCHIGAGTGWFVKSKLSGSYQVYSVLFNKYPRPIPTPIHNLRPARETCEQCHWTKKFYNEKLITTSYFLNDENNSKWTIKLALKIGEGNPETGLTSGIHWHVNLENEVRYISSDDKRMEIPVVIIRVKDGKDIIYKTTKNLPSKEELSKLEVRTMDCIDCHNHPAHIYNPSSVSLNNYMSIGLIKKELPYIKSISLQALDKTYKSKQEGLEGIKALVEDFYRTNYPDVYKNQRNGIAEAVEQLKHIYERNYFPEMGVSWKKYPMQVGHMFAPGCFRCHDGLHKSSDGKVISKDCNLCHTIISQQYENETPIYSATGLEYKHPVEIGKALAEMNCSDCHTKN